MLGLGAYPALNFLTGHVIWSFAPIALTEAAAGRYAQALWLRRAGLAVVGVLYLGAAALILSEHLRTEDDHATPAQIAGSLVLVLLLAGFAFTRGRRAAARDDRPVPRPRWLLALGVIVGAILDLVPSNWAGFAGRAWRCWPPPRSPWRVSPARGGGPGGTWWRSAPERSPVARRSAS